MRLADAEHTTRPWRIHAIAPDFRLEDVWAYRTPGAGPGDFPIMLDALRAGGGLNENPPVVRALFAARWKLGALFGWDKPRQGVAGRVGSLCDRLPADLRQDAAGEAVPNTPFTMVYELSDECAIELANKTVHDICHLGWVRSDSGEYELRMAALVKPNGMFGRLYMAAIKPFRYLIVYPALTRKWERAWRNRSSVLATGSSDVAGSGGCDAAPVAAEHHEDAATGGTRAGPHGLRSSMITWAGRLLVLYGAAHTIGAFAVEGAARHAGAWFRGELWGADLSAMSQPTSAYWLSVTSFGPPLILIGLTVLWLDRRGTTPPRFIAWALGAWTLLDIVLAGPGGGQGLIMLLAVVLLLAGARRNHPKADVPWNRHDAGGQGQSNVFGSEVMSINPRP